MLLSIVLRALQFYHEKTGKTNSPRVSHQYLYGVTVFEIVSWAPSQYKDRLIYVWRFPC